MLTRILTALAALALFACKPATPPSVPPSVPGDAALLYDVDFSAPEHTVGKVVAVLPDGAEQTFPSRIPSQLFFGNATVVDKLCGLDQQPLSLAVARATQGMEGIEILLDQRYGHYRIELDLCVAKLEAPTLASQKIQLLVFLDIAAAYALGFMADGTIGIVDPIREPETTENPRLVGNWSPDKPMRLAFDADSGTQRWQVSIDGKQVYDGPVEMTIPRAVRVVIRGNQANSAAIDNVLIWGQRELADEDDVTPPATGEDSR